MTLTFDLLINVCFNENQTNKKQLAGFMPDLFDIFDHNWVYYDEIVGFLNRVLVVGRIDHLSLLLSFVVIMSNVQYEQHINIEVSRMLNQKMQSLQVLYNVLKRILYR